MLRSVAGSAYRVVCPTKYAKRSASQFVREVVLIYTNPKSGQIRIYCRSAFFLNSYYPRGPRLGVESRAYHVSLWLWDSRLSRFMHDSEWHGERIDFVALIHGICILDVVCACECNRHRLWCFVSGAPWHWMLLLLAARSIDLAALRSIPIIIKVGLEEWIVHYTP